MFTHTFLEKVPDLMTSLKVNTCMNTIADLPMYIAEHKVKDCMIFMG